MKMYKMTINRLENLTEKKKQIYYRVFQKFVYLISCAITFDRNFIYMEFLNDIDRLLYQVHVVRSSLIQHSPPFFDSSHSAAVAA